MANHSLKATGTITRKGQVTIPAEMRKALGLEVGDRIEFNLEGKRLTVEARESAVAKTAGIFKERARQIDTRPPTAEELRDSAADAWVADVAERGKG